jgi:dihydroorotate dehydrogenase (NAD+) catalytic subunit
MFKRDLTFHKPMMNAAGTLGFAPDFRTLEEIGYLGDFGAFVTNPVSLRPRTAAAQPNLIEYPGGFLLHTGLPNPGFESVIRKQAHRWKDTSLPIIVHLMADRPEETKQMVEALEDLENVMAAELGFAPLLAADILMLTLEMCAGELPLIFSLPAEQVLSVGPRLIQNGAVAISLAAPRGSLLVDGMLVTGRLFGPSLFPLALDIVNSATRLGLPIIGAGGVYSRENADAMLSIGALAVQMDTNLWLPKNKKDLVT